MEGLRSTLFDRLCNFKRESKYRANVQVSPISKSSSQLSYSFLFDAFPKMDASPYFRGSPMVYVNVGHARLQHDRHVRVCV